MGGRRFAPRFPEADLAAWASRFPLSEDDNRLLDTVRPAVLARGYLERAEFLELCAWKSARSKPNCARNPEPAIRTLTRAAFDATDEALKMDLLRLLRGVEWPTASAILHFCGERPYPVLDVRVLWSLGFARTTRYTMEFWIAYVEFMRGLAARTGLSVRALDRALWQYSKERQRSR